MLFIKSNILKMVITYGHILNKKEGFSILLWNMVWVCIYNFIAHRLWKLFWKRKADIICPYFKLKPNKAALRNGHMIYCPKNVFFQYMQNALELHPKFLIFVFNTMFKSIHVITKVLIRTNSNVVFNSKTIQHHMLFFIPTCLAKV